MNRYMVSEPGYGSNVFLFLFRLVLHTKRILSSKFVRGHLLCWLLWFLLEPGITTTLGRAMVYARARERRHFWRRVSLACKTRLEDRPWCWAVWDEDR